LTFFDFSGEVQRAIWAAPDEMSRWAARTEVGCRLFPDAVRRAGFSLLRPGEEFVPDTNEFTLIVGAASWSDPDLAALDRLAKSRTGRPSRVIVLDVDDWSLDNLLRTFPGSPKPNGTPFVLRYEHGKLAFFGDKHDAILWLDQI
jgi:hypothetical protein